jgi:hypothetical protein
MLLGTVQTRLTLALPDVADVSVGAVGVVAALTSVDADIKMATAIMTKSSFISFLLMWPDIFIMFKASFGYGFFLNPDIKDLYLVRYGWSMTPDLDLHIWSRSAFSSQSRSLLMLAKAVIEVIAIDDVIETIAKAFRATPSSIP